MISFISDQTWTRQYRSRMDSKIMSVSDSNNQLRTFTLSQDGLKICSSISFYCPFEFYRMICIPMYRVILAFINTNKRSSWILLLGDVSRQGIFLSKQELPHIIYSVLYIHATSMLFLGRSL